MSAGSLEPTIEADYTFAHDQPFALVAGGRLQPVTLRYALYGELNDARDNAILVCHALSGSARVADWWPQLFGANSLFDTSRYCVVGINVPGSCYGSTGPQSPNPSKPGETYGGDFPLVTVSDMVEAEVRLLNHLKIERLACVIGGSVGGMQALRFAVNFPERVERCIAIGAAPLSAMGLALNHLQRVAIRNDPAWLEGRYAPDSQPVRGLALARALAMCSYKSAELFNERFARRPDRSGEDPHASMSERFDVAGYLDYQGSRFTERFDANSYLVISKAMDNFDLARGYTTEAEALRRITARLLMVGISSDWLFPASDVRALTERAQAAGVDATYRELASSHGHDGFLADAARLAAIVAGHLDEAAVLSGDTEGMKASGVINV
jgi:homoserine O-acetyltransferase